MQIKSSKTIPNRAHSYDSDTHIQIYKTTSPYKDYGYGFNQIGTLIAAHRVGFLNKRRKK